MDNNLQDDFSYFKHVFVKTSQMSDTLGNTDSLRPGKRIRIWGEIGHLVFPEQCLVCSTELTVSEKSICSLCENDLALTQFEHFTEASPMDQLFWGRVSVSKTYAHFYFEKTKASQTLLFRLKYKHKQQLGVHLGQRVGALLHKTTGWKEMDALLPVPLHPRKAFIRGYNQSEAIAKGISETLGVPMQTRWLKRNSFTETQTKKSRFERWENVQSRFRVHKNLETCKHVILVDDVITTGSTLEAIIREIREVHPDLKISIITLAMAR